VNYVVSQGFSTERVTRIELALSAWEADVLPLNYTRERQTLPTTIMPTTALPANPTG
jgi:hypothetical protein